MPAKRALCVPVAAEVNAESLTERWHAEGTDLEYDSDGIDFDELFPLAKKPKNEEVADPANPPATFVEISEAKAQFGTPHGEHPSSNDASSGEVQGESKDGSEDSSSSEGKRLVVRKATVRAHVVHIICDETATNKAEPEAELQSDEKSSAEDWSDISSEQPCLEANPEHPTRREAVRAHVVQVLNDDVHYPSNDPATDSRPSANSAAADANIVDVSSDAVLCDNVTEMIPDNIAMSFDNIAAMSHGNIAETIPNNIAAMSPDNVAAMSHDNITKTIPNNIAAISSDNVAAMSPDYIAEMNVNGSEVISPSEQATVVRQQVIYVETDTERVTAPKKGILIDEVAGRRRCLVLPDVQRKARLSFCERVYDDTKTVTGKSVPASVTVQKEVNIEAAAEDVKQDDNRGYLSIENLPIECLSGSLGASLVALLAQTGEVVDCRLRKSFSSDKRAGCSVVYRTKEAALKAKLFMSEQTWNNGKLDLTVWDV
ncbi:AARP1 protein [Diplonema papillatum]|nr:AARP1 protein [Diplonema papillatum]